LKAMDEQEEQRRGGSTVTAEQGSSVAVKQTTQEELGAHPEHVEDDERAGGTTERRVDGHSDHGGASNGDGGAPMAVMDEMTKQQGVKHHDIKAKLELR